MSIFYKIGKFSSSNPWIAFLLCISITIVLGMGMYNLHLQTDPQGMYYI